MKPFNLTDFKAGKKVVTRDGREVKQLTVFDDIKDNYKLVGIVNGEFITLTIEGIWDEDNVESCYDLFHPDEEISLRAYKGTINIFVDGMKTYESIPDGNYKLVKVD